MDEKELILHPDRQGLRMILGDLEADIMDVIWSRCGADKERWCTVRDVYEAMREDRRIAYTTVMNTMTRLAKKSVLESTRRDLPYLYRPRQSRDDFIHSVVGHVVERLLVQFEGPAHTALESYAGIHPGEKDRLNCLLEEIARRRAESGSSELSESDL